MLIRKTTALLLATTALSFSAAAYAQEAAPAADAAPSAEDAAAEIEFLKAQVDAMQAQLDVLKKKTDTATPSFKAAPEWKDGDWKFKVRGRFMYDVGYISNPGINTKNLGFNTHVRRARLGVEGTMPAGFSYKMEADFADNGATWADAFIEYKNPKSPFSVRAGHFETFQSLEQITSSRHIMFLERAQMNESFNHGRKLGLAVGYDKNDILLRAGIFNDTLGDIKTYTYDNDQWQVGARLVYAPKIGNNQYHFGVNYQHREFKSTAQAFQYRMRNIARLSDVRMVDTDKFAASGDDVFGLEAAAIMGSLHVVSEAQWVKPNTIDPRTLVNGDAAGTTNRLAGNPTFFSGYVEAGYWLTGETRGYKKGEWDRTKVKNPFDKGGMGAFAVTARYDYLDLSDPVLTSGGSGTSLSKGGKQSIYALSLVWQPIDYVRVTTQYAHNEVEGGPYASVVVPTSTKPVDQRGYGVDSFAMRFAFDF